MFGRTEIVKLLLDYNADVNAKDIKGITALMAGKYFNNICYFIFFNH